MRRREFITLLGGVATGWPLAVRAAFGVIDWLSRRLALRPSPKVCQAFHLGLKETGLVEGRDFAIEYRSTGEQTARVVPAVAETVARRVSVIVAVSNSIALAAKAATTAIPIVYIGGNDPVKMG